MIFTDSHYSDGRAMTGNQRKNHVKPHIYVPTKRGHTNTHYILSDQNLKNEMVK